MSGTWRTALQPRWLALLGVVGVLCVVFGWLGHWQLDVAKSKENPHRNTAAAAPLDQVTEAQQVFRGNMVGRAVTVRGEYDASRQVLVTGKRLHGVDGVWVLTALRVPSGALVPVVRGFLPTTAAHSGQLVPPTGPVALAGSLQPPEPVADADVPTPPAGEVPAADTADLVNLWGGPIYNVLVYDEGTTPGLTAVPAPPPDDGGGLGLRNAAYAVQWWLFAAFAVLLWWRMVRQDALDTAAAAVAADQPKELSAS